MKELTQYLLSYVSERRVELFHEILSQRTQHLTLVLEDFYQAHNFSAVLRSCDCFGVQDVHIIENYNEYTSNPKVNLGSEKWLDLHRYNKNENNTIECIKDLKSKGFQVLAAHPHDEDISLFDVDVSQKTAVLLGTEMKGVSDIAKEHVDGFMKIPMYGFTESFNVSVAAALTLNHLRNELNHLPKAQWELSQEEKDRILLNWARASINTADLLEKEFLSRGTKL